jgi:hypothetical protein
LICLRWITADEGGGAPAVAFRGARKRASASPILYASVGYRHVGYSKRGGEKREKEKNMHYAATKFARGARTWAAVLAMAAAVGIAGMPEGQADEAQAKDLFKAMSDYLTAQKAISFEYDTSLEIVTKDNQRIALASSGTVTFNRPDKIRATRWGGFANVETVFDAAKVLHVHNWRHELIIDI